MALQDVLECGPGLKAGAKSPFWVANDTGVAVSFWLAASLQPANSRPPGVPSWQHQPLPSPHTYDVFFYPTLSSLLNAHIGDGAGTPGSQYTVQMLLYLISIMSWTGEPVWVIGA